MGQREASDLEALSTGSTDLVPGDYYVSTGLNRLRVLDVSGGSLADCANVQSWSTNATGAQRWRVGVDAQGWATLTNIGSGKALDVACGSSAPGANVWQYAPNGTAAQRWSVESQGDGTYVLRSALSRGMMLDVAGALDADGANVQLWTSNGTAAQRFSFTPCDPAVAPGAQLVADGVYTVAPACAPSSRLDISGASFAEGANLQLWEPNGTFAQSFGFAWDVAAGAYTVTSLSSGKVLGADSASTLLDANVSQHAPSGALSQLWRIDGADGGGYVLTNMATGRVLDVAGASAADGANVGTYASNGTDAQRFALSEDADPVPDGCYELCPNVAGDLAVDVPAASAAPGLQLQSWSSNGTLAQRFSVARQGDGSYVLRSLVSGLTLADVGGAVVQADVGSAAARWLVSLASGGLVLENAATGAVMDVVGGSAAPGTALQTYASNGTLAQRFRLVETDPVQSGAVYELAPKTSEVLRADVAGGSRIDGANLQIYTANGTNAQKFSITKVGKFWRLTGAVTNKAVDVAGGDGSSGANVHMWSINGTDAQLWDIEISESGGYIFKNIISGTCLTVCGSGLIDECNIAAYTEVIPASPAQEWRLIPTAIVIEDLVLDRAIQLANGQWSNTGYLITVDLSAHRTVVFQGQQGNWQAIKNMVCSTGSPFTPTVLGEFVVGIRGYSFGHGYTCYYYTQFYGDYLFHSVLYQEGTWNILDGTLGAAVSQGCVRLDVNDAKWIYDAIPRRTKVITYY